METDTNTHLAGISVRRKHKDGEHWTEPEPKQEKQRKSGGLLFELS